MTLSASNREMASSRSLSDNRLVLAGKSGRMKAAMMAQPIVAAPSTIWIIISISKSMIKPQARRTNSHLQPLSPCAPSRPPVMPPAMIPPNAPDKTAAEIYTAKRFDCSFFRYQEERIKRTPGANPASKTPTIVRNATNWWYDWTNDMQHVAIPQSVMITGRNMDGLVFESKRFDGTSKRTYVMTIDALVYITGTSDVMINVTHKRRAVKSNIDSSPSQGHLSCQLLLHCRCLCATNVLSSSPVTDER